MRQDFIFVIQTIKVDGQFLMLIDLYFDRTLLGKILPSDDSYSHGCALSSTGQFIIHYSINIQPTKVRFAQFDETGLRMTSSSTEYNTSMSEIG